MVDRVRVIRVSDVHGGTYAEDLRDLSELGGAEGPAGPQGEQGPQGIQGPAGADGADGAQGIQGDQGIQGPPGNDGAQGSAGADGSDGANGQGVPAGGTAGQELRKKSATDYDTEWFTPEGGSDPWTYLRLTNDFTASAAAAVSIAALSFAPAANQRYEFVARLMVRTATATVGPRPGIAWATGLADGVVFIQQTSSATANVFANGNISGAVLAPVGGVPTTNGSWPALIEGMAVAGANPSGNIAVQLASETAGTNVFAKAGSFMKYRTIP